MKLIVLLTMIISASSFAGGLGRTFSTTENVNAMSYGASGYKVDQQISILVETVSSKTAQIYLDNERKTINVKKIGSEPGKQTYEGVLKVDMIAPGFTCDEKEEVVYTVKIEVEQYDEYRFINKAVEVKAIHDYSYDVCHDTSWGPEKEIVYNLTF